MKKVICVKNFGFSMYTKKVEFFDLTVGNEYTVIREFDEEGIDYFELQFDDNGVPCTEFQKSLFLDFSLN